MPSVTKGKGSSEAKRLTQAGETSSATSGRRRRAGATTVGVTAEKVAAAFNPKRATFLGQFVEAAYSMYQADPTQLTPAPTPDFPAA